jgi:hypothetical protein
LCYRLQAIEPITKVRTFASHPINSYGVSRERPIDDFTIGICGAKDTFRWRTFRIIVNILGVIEPVTYFLKLSGEGWMLDGCCKSRGIAEKQALVFVQLYVRNKSDVRSKIRNLMADVFPHRFFDSQDLLNIREGWR